MMRFATCYGMPDHGFCLGISELTTVNRLKDIQKIVGRISLHRWLSAQPLLVDAKSYSR